MSDDTEHLDEEAEVLARVKPHAADFTLHVLRMLRGDDLAPPVDPADENNPAD